MEKRFLIFQHGGFLHIANFFLENRRFSKYQLKNSLSSGKLFTQGYKKMQKYFCSSSGSINYSRKYMGKTIG